MLTLKNAAEYYGLQTIVAKFSTDQLKDFPMPMILYWNQNHYVVLVKASENKFKIADPAKGIYTCDKREFESCWIGDDFESANRKGIGMLLEPNSDFVVTEKSMGTSLLDTLRLIGRYFFLYKGFFAQILVGLILGCVLQLSMPFLTQAIVDKGIKNSDINIVWLILIGETMIVIAQTITNFIRGWLVLHISMRVKISLVSDFLIKLFNLPMSFFDKKKIGDTLQRIGDHDRIQSFLTTQSLSFILAILSFIVFGSVLIYYNILVSLVFLGGSAIYLLWIGIFLKKRKIIDYELFGLFSKNQSRTYELISNVQEIKLHNCEDRQRWRWEDVQAEVFMVQMKSLRLQQTQESGSVLIKELKNLLITVVTASAVIKGSMSLGAMMAVQYIIGQMNSPLDQMMSFIYALQDVKISLERINEIHDRDNEEKSEKDFTEFDTENGSIKCNDIHFSYERFAKDKTIRGVTLKIPIGKVTAIVGESGSGKSTLIKLLLGYYPVDAGEILIGRSPIQNYSQKWWRKQCGAVMQNGVIFSDTIGRNIAIADEEIDREKLYYAAKLANILSFVEGLPLGFETIIGSDGSGLSEGQKQRILIARAIYKNPTIVFFDEATNSLDAENEKIIVENLKSFFQGRTVVIVAHRLSTVKSADNILVMEQGRIIEEGNHESLLRKKGKYYSLIKNQLELGK